MYTEGLILSDETNSCAFECEFPVFPVIVENIPLFVMTDDCACVAPDQDLCCHL